MNADPITLVRSLDPLGRRGVDVTDDALDLLAARLFAEVPAPAAGPVSRRRRRWVMAAGAVAVLGLPAFTYAASQNLFLDDDPHAAAGVKQVIADIPLPAGTNLDTWIASVFPGSPRPGGESGYDRVGVHTAAEFGAICLWYRDWIGGDSARRAADLRTIDAIPTWPGIHFANPVNPLETIAQQLDHDDPTNAQQWIRANCEGSPLEGQG
jgi:hypothetical protein